jgi:acylphosphatase
MMDNNENKKACSIAVYGFVQGVGYRYYAVKTAAHFHISGWVRNNRDGSVEIECEGEAEDIRSFIESLKQGPPYARVSSVEVQMKQYQGVYSGFSIEY